jgi:hypothetical protein
MILGGADMGNQRTLRQARYGAARSLVAFSFWLFAIPAIAGDLDRLKLPGLVTDVQRDIDTRPNPNALPNPLPPSQSGPAGSQDDALPGASLSPKLNPPGLEFKKAF